LRLFGLIGKSPLACSGVTLARRCER